MIEAFQVGDMFRNVFFGLPYDDTLYIEDISDEYSRYEKGWLKWIFMDLK